jgi:hypothetical protein
MDVIKVEILEDGTVVTKTDKISEANHYSADELMDALQKEIGVLHSKTELKHSHVHGSAHVHHHNHMLRKKVTS